jgi:hypothetical protein
MTLDTLETFRERLSKNEFAVARMLIAGMNISNIRSALGISQVRLYPLILRAEEVVGRRLRRAHGEKSTDRLPLSLQDDDDPTVVAARCPVCHLAEPHACVELQYKRPWESEY